MYMQPVKSLIAALAVCALCSGTAAAGDKLSIYGSVSGSSSLGMLGRYTDLGLGGTVAIGLRPFPVSRDIEFVALAAYDRFANTNADMGQFSFLLIGSGIRLNLDVASPNRIYLMLNLGPAFVRIDPNSGFPPFKGNSRSSTNLYGAGGVGYEFGVGQPFGIFAEAELVDVLDTMFGDYRFLKLNLGVRF